MGKIVKVSGPLVVATGMADANMADVVRVGEQRLIGEILTMTGDAASIQVTRWKYINILLGGGICGIGGLFGIGAFVDLIVILCKPGPYYYV